MTRRVGLIIPSSNRMVEQEMVRHFPDGVVAHVNRLRMTGPNRKPLSELLPDVEGACAELVDAKCEAVAFHCTANSMAEGSGGEAALLEALRRAKAPNVATTSTAVMNALGALNAKRIALVTPYSQSATEEETHFFDEAGIEVVHAKGATGAAATPIAQRLLHSGKRKRCRSRIRISTRCSCPAPTSSASGSWTTSKNNWDARHHQQSGRDLGNAAPDRLAGCGPSAGPALQGLLTLYPARRFDKLDSARADNRARQGGGRHEIHTRADRIINLQRFKWRLRG